MQQSLLITIPVAVLCLAAAAWTQGTQGTQDWKTIVQKSQKHRRIMLRRAAGKKVAGGGDAAVPAVRAWEKEHGRNSLRLELLTAYSEVIVNQPETLELLEEWAKDRIFYWRSQALAALAERRMPRYLGLFKQHLDDVAYLSRIQGARGLCLLGRKEDRPAVLALLRDEDPRVRLEVALSLCREGDMRGLPTLVAALSQESRFLDYPWGPLGALKAYKALAKLAGESYGYLPGGKPEENQESIQSFTAFARERLGEEDWRSWQPASGTPAETRKFIGGVEIRSCRHGDLFIRWTQEGTLVFGLSPTLSLKLPAPAWEKLDALRPDEEGRGVKGKAVCDYLRVLCENPTVDKKFYPGTLSKDLSAYLKTMASVLEEQGREELATQIRTRLEQFTPAPAKKE